MPGDVDDVVGAAHHVDIARLADVAGIAGEVVAGKGGQIRLAEAVCRVPERRRRPRRHRQLDRERAGLPRRRLVAVALQHPHVPARHRTRR